MPAKRKGKIRVYPSTPPPSASTQLEINRFLIQLEQRGAEDSVGGTGNGDPGTPQEEASLSPESRLPPAQRSEDNGEVLQIPMVGDTDPGEPLSQNGGQLLQTTSGLGQVTLERILEAVNGLSCAMTRMEKKMDNVTTEFQGKLLNVQTQNIETIRRLTENEKDLKSLQQVNVCLIKDQMASARRLEILENRMRHLNIRITNFPQVLAEIPYLSLKRFLREKLSYTEEDIPQINSCYFLTQRTQVPENLSNFLEDSTLDVVHRNTLIVSFLTSQDVSKVMIRYFKKFPTSFHGQVVKLYPDLAPITRSRRKEFLALRQQIVSMGYVFLLRFLCRCELKKGEQIYVFHQVNQLQQFIDAQQINITAIETPIAESSPTSVT